MKKKEYPIRTIFTVVGTIVGLVLGWFINRSSHTSLVLDSEQGDTSGDTKEN